MGDFDLGTLANLENHGAETTDTVPLDGVVDGNLIVAGLLIKLAELFRVLLHLPLVEGLVGFDLHLFLKAG